MEILSAWQFWCAVVVGYVGRDIARAILRAYPLPKRYDAVREYGPAAIKHNGRAFWSGE